MSNHLQEAIEKSGQDPEMMRLAMSLMSILPPEELADQFVAELIKNTENGADPDLTPNEREWAVAFYDSEAYRTMMTDLIREYGVEHALEKIAEVNLDDTQDITFLTSLTDEDPVKMAAVYASEVEKKYIPYR